jgi:adenine phosphoribosyltransferase
MELTTSDVYVPVAAGEGPSAGREAEPGPWPPTVYSPGREAGDRELAREVREALGAGAGTGDLLRDVAAVARRPGLVRRMARRGAEEASDRGADAVAAVEGPGLVLAVPLALEADLPLVVFRRSGRRPPAGAGRDAGVTPPGAGGTGGGEASDLTAGPRALEPWSRLLLVDAVLGAGDALDAAADLVEKSGSRVAGAVVVVDASAAEGSGRIGTHEVLSLLRL